MAVLLDDWTLSGLNGAMDWTVVLPPGTVNRGASSLSGVFEQKHFYPALFTELTPTVLTGSESASAVTAATKPIVYARLSSIVSVEKVGPRQLRLRQQLGWPGSYRLLFLTTSSEAACDDWWRALHRLTYNNADSHSALETAFLSSFDERVVRDNSSSVSVKERWPQQQQPQMMRSSVPREVAPWPRVSAAASKVLPSQPAAPPAVGDVGVAELKRVLLSPTPDAGSAAARPSPVLSGDYAPLPLSAQTSTEAATQAESPPPATAAAASLSASTIDSTKSTTSAANAPAATTAPDVAAAKPRHYRHRHRYVQRVPVTDAVAAPSAPPPPPLAVLRAARSEATQTTAPVSVSRPEKTVIAPALSLLLQEKREDSEQEVCASDAAALPRMLTPPQQHQQERSRLEPMELRLDTSNAQSASLPFAPNLSLSLPAWKAGAAAAALAPAGRPAMLDPRLYEPIHVDSAAVPRSCSTSPAAPCLEAPLLCSSAVAAARALTRRSHSEPSAWTPRITYGDGRAGRWLLRRPLLSRPFLLDHSRRSSLPPSSSLSPWPQSRRQHRSRSRRASTAKPQSRGSRSDSRSASSASDLDGEGVSPLLSVIARPHLFLKHPVQVPPHRSASSRDSSQHKRNSGGGESVATYIFLTTDEDCVVVVPARRFQECVEEAKLLKRRGPMHRSRSSNPYTLASISIGVRSYERARHFFGQDHCRAIRVAELDRVTRGNEEPLILLNASRRERFRDPANLVCIVSHTHAFLMEATNSMEAEWYVRNWKKYLHARHGSHAKANDNGY